MRTGLAKMASTVVGANVAYFLSFPQHRLCLNDYLGKRISLAFNGLIHCIQCHRQIKKTFQQGYCYPCMQQIMECNNCMIHPERCQVESGQCPDTWAHAHCHRQQVVYFSHTSGLKVGVTQLSNQPSRWVDQGATQAVALFECDNRYRAGLLEVCFKSVMNDKTHWQKMLKTNPEPIDLLACYDLGRAQLGDKLVNLLGQSENKIRQLPSPCVIELNYPVLAYPSKIRSLSFDKSAVVEGCLLGIKGQYLILDTGVINIRKFSGYEITWSAAS